MCVCEIRGWDKYTEMWKEPFCIKSSNDEPHTNGEINTE